MDGSCIERKCITKERTFSSALFLFTAFHPSSRLWERKEVPVNQKGLTKIALLAVSTAAYGAVDPVSKWNELAVQATLAAGEGAVTQSRTLPIVQVAIASGQISPLKA
jgi:hypothetical protein